jgi:hypothetical protein
LNFYYVKHQRDRVKNVQIFLLKTNSCGIEKKRLVCLEHDLREDGVQVGEGAHRQMERNGAGVFVTGSLFLAGSPAGAKSAPGRAKRAL